MKPHADKQKLDALFPSIREYQALATAHGINDIFQDNGGKLLQLLVTLGLTIVPGREGNDARDAQGHEYEVKTLNLNLTSNFSTHHHLNMKILANFRSVQWIFAFYRGIELSSVYKMMPTALESLFEKWEKKLSVGLAKDLNNPKIPARFVCDNGQLVFGIRPEQGLPRSRK